ncbi:MAG TPA: response regulator [Bryobacteraceae bacterium]|jgi:CheY-like chemotaxis protein|nr:response regulator [Bryobacteraceae bacterium]
MKRVLVADDKASSRELVRTVLERCGYEVIEASDGEEAVDLARAGRPHLILLDLHMPKLDGFGAIGQLRSEAAFAATPVVALTASAMDVDREQALAAGFSGYITKPIRLATLRSEVERLLG